MKDTIIHINRMHLVIMALAFIVALQSIYNEMLSPFLRKSRVDILGTEYVMEIIKQDRRDDKQRIQNFTNAVRHLNGIYPDRIY